MEFAPHPDAVKIDSDLIGLLRDLHRLLDGALALVSGRVIASLDRLFEPLRLPCAGMHGVQRRLSENGVVLEVDTGALPRGLKLGVAHIIAPYESAFIEDKGATLAVHHCLMPDSAAVLWRQLQELCAPLSDDWICLRGRQVIEIKPRHVSKADGALALLRAPAFRDRIPVGFGDDSTDLDLFRTVAQHDGINVSVGPRIAGAGHFRLASPRHTIELLHKFALALHTAAAPCDEAALLRSMVQHLN